MSGGETCCMAIYYGNRQRKLTRRPERTLTFSGIIGVNVAGYDTEFEPLRDIAGLRVNRFAGSKGGRGPTPSIPNLSANISIMTQRSRTCIARRGVKSVP